MRFSTDAQKACFEKVSSWLNETYAGCIRSAEELPALFITRESAMLQVAVLPFNDSVSVIQCRAYVVSGVELTAELMRFLLEQNTHLRFGSFGIDIDGDIILEHSCLSTTSDRDSIRAMVEMLLATANGKGAEITARWGGQRAKEPEI